MVCEDMQPKDGDKLSCNHELFCEDTVWFDESDKKDLVRKVRKLMECGSRKNYGKVLRDKIYNGVCERDGQFGAKGTSGSKFSCQGLLLGEQKRGFIEGLRDWFPSDMSSLEDQKFYFQLTQLLKNYKMDCSGTYKKLSGEEEVGNTGVGPVGRV